MNTPRHLVFLLRPPDDRILREVLLKTKFRGANDLIPPANPSAKVGGFAPPPFLMGFLGAIGRLDTQYRVLRKTYQRVGVAPNGPRQADSRERLAGQSRGGER